MKTLNYLFALIVLSFIIGSCSSDFETVVPDQESTSKDVSARAANAPLPLPTIVHYNAFIDTLTQWALRIEPDRNHGRYSQFQCWYGNSWRNIPEVTSLHEIYLQKEHYPYGDLFFRARTLTDDRLAVWENLSIYEASPWSNPLPARNNLLPGGIPCTDEDLGIEFKFNFTRNGGDWISASLSDFQVEIKEGNSTKKIPNQKSQELRHSHIYTNITTQ